MPIMLHAPYRVRDGESILFELWLLMIFRHSWNIKGSHWKPLPKRSFRKKYQILVGMAASSQLIKMGISLWNSTPPGCSAPLWMTGANYFWGCFKINSITIQTQFKSLRNHQQC